MAKYELKLPHMGESVAEATITSWLKKVGETIEAEDIIVEVATDKVDSEIPCEVSGIVTEILFEVDQVVQVGQVMAIIETDITNANTTTETPIIPEVEEKTTTPITPVVEQTPEVTQIEKSIENIVNNTPIISTQERFYSPLVKTIAHQENISVEELNQIQGSGLDGRVTKYDILAYLGKRNPQTISTPTQSVVNESISSTDNSIKNITEEIVDNTQPISAITQQETDNESIKVEETNHFISQVPSPDNTTISENIAAEPQSISEESFTEPAIKTDLSSVVETPLENISTDNQPIKENIVANEPINTQFEQPTTIQEVVSEDKVNTGIEPSSISNDNQSVIEETKPTENIIAEEKVVKKEISFPDFVVTQSTETPKVEDNIIPEENTAKKEISSQETATAQPIAEVKVENNIISGENTTKKEISFPETAIKQPSSQTTKVEQVATSTPISEDVEVIEMTRMGKLISKYMVESKRISPHVQSFTEVDVTRIWNWRNKVKKKFEQQEGQKFTFTPIFIEAVSKALRDFPMMNVSTDGERIFKKKHINIGMATALPNGDLIVPVIKNADTLSLVGLAKSVNDLAQRARENKLKPDEIKGGTYTVTNIGSFGNVFGTPIINQPEVGILAIGAIQKVPAVIETPEGDVIGIRYKMMLSHSYDHRVVNGALGGMFVQRVAEYLEKWNIDRVL